MLSQEMEPPQVGMGVGRVRGGYAYTRTHIHFQKLSPYPSSFRYLSQYPYPPGISGMSGFIRVPIYDKKQYPSGTQLTENIQTFFGYTTFYCSQITKQQKIYNYAKIR